MLSRLRDLFSPPIFEDDSDKTYQARIAFTVALIVFGLSLAGFVVNYLLSGLTSQVPLLASGLVIVLVAIYLIKRKKVTAGSFLLIASAMFIIYGNTFLAGGLQRPTFHTNLLLLAVGMLLFRKSGPWVISAAMVIFNFSFLWIETSQPSLVPASGPVSIVNITVVNTFIVLSVAALMQFAVANFNETLNKAKSSEEAARKSHLELQKGTELEKLVTERTLALETSSRQLERRARQLTAITEVSRSIASIRDTETLLSAVARVISAQFGFYHTGIFLIDDKREYAELKAASSEGGMKMLARKHKLRVGETGIVGYVTGSGKPRIALDTGEDAIHFKNPDLPGTHSELALPLFLENRVGGAIDIQSTEPNAFSSEDITALTTLANQVAIAIENAEMFSRTNRALAESQAIYQRFVQENWSKASQEFAAAGFRLSQGKAEILPEPLQDPDLVHASQNGEVIVNQPGIEGELSSLAIPVMLRGETIGVLGVRTNRENKIWQEEDVATAVTLAERLALALENARLVQDSQIRASRERSVAEMSAKIGASIDIDAILKSTVEEVGKLIGDSEVSIRLGAANNQGN